jgi:ParB-like chromosome segregation protein Spo0J
MTSIRNLALDAINATGGTQSRAELNHATVSEYAEALGHGVKFPPVIVFSDGAAGGNWLADGFHRYHAHRGAGLVEIACEIRTGTRRDAVLFSVGANSSHGLRRTNEDKRNAVETLLSDPEWATWSNNAIAKACSVSDKTVAAYRADHLRKSEDGAAVPTKRTVERSGSTYEQDTSKIGKPSPPPPAASPTTAHAAAPAARPTLVQQAQEQASRSADEPVLPQDTVETDPFEKLHEDFDALQRAHDKLRTENEALEAQVAFLSQDDMAAEAQRWKSNFEGIYGRNAGLTKKLNELEPDAEYMRETLQQIRQAMGVERNSDIVPALKARRAA